MIGALITLIVYLLILGLLFWLIDYILKAIPIPDPPAKIIRIALMVLMVLIVIVLLLDLFGMTRSGLDLPRMNP